MSGRSVEVGRSVISKAVAILDALRTAETELTRTQIARRTNLPMTTVYRMLGELMRAGALERGPTGRYRVGVRLWEIGATTTQCVTLREVAMPFLQDLYEATHENIQLAVLDGLDALVVEKIHGRQSVPIVSRVGGRLPLHATGVGKALLAFADQDYVEDVIGQGLQALTPFTIVDPDTLRHCLAEVRRSGFAHTRDEMTLGSVSVAAPVFGPDENVVAAISVVVKSERADPARLVPVVRAVAMGLSREVAERLDLDALDHSDAAHPANGRLATAAAFRMSSDVLRTQARALDRRG